MKKRFCTCISLLILAFVCSVCSKNESAFNFPLADENNISEERLISAFEKAENVEGMASLVVFRNDVFVAEKYFNNYRSDSIKNVHSVTKTITSMLIGLALNKGYIESINDPISKYLSGIVVFPDEVKAGITIEQMLKMSFGHAWNGTSSESLYSAFASADDHLQYILDLPLVSTPGTVFNYSDGASHLLSVIITEATGMNTLDFANENLFEPLGIMDIVWNKDDRGYPNGASSLKISPHHMIKIGNLILNQGRYNGVQIIPENWISEMTSTKISTNNNIPFGPEYGYQIWINQEAQHKYFFAMGWGGQFIFIVPEQNLIITASCATENLDWRKAGEHWTEIINIIVNDVFPSVN